MRLSFSLIGHLTTDLYFVSDKTNWWNIYRFDGSENRPVLALDGEFATPLWQFGMATYDFIDTDTIACLMDR